MGSGENGRGEDPAMARAVPGQLPLVFQGRYKSSHSPHNFHFFFFENGLKNNDQSAASHFFLAKRARDGHKARFYFKIFKIFKKHD